MTELQINQLIHQKVLGKCWHEWEYDDVSYSVVWETRFKCRKCGEETWVDYGSMPSNPSSTSSWADYGPMLEECMKKEWWRELAYYMSTDDTTYADYEFKEDILNPLRGSTAIAEFVEANPQYFKGEKE